MHYRVLPYTTALTYLYAFTYGGGELKIIMNNDHNYNIPSSLEGKIVKYNCHIVPKNSNIIFNSISASVLPSKANWSDMEGFSGKKYGPFEINFMDESYNNVAGISFYISYNCNGKYNSKGAYLTDIIVAPKIIYAKPTYYFTCDVTFSEPINYGTAEDPIAGITLTLKMEVKSYNSLDSSYDLSENSNLKTSHSPLSSYTFDNSINSIVKYLIVGIRGDGKVSIISGFNY